MASTSSTNLVRRRAAFVGAVSFQRTTTRTSSQRRDGRGDTMASMQPVHTSTRTTNATATSATGDAELLARLGYAQDLQRRMGRFSNFAVSFSIICILAGGITAFPAALGAGGGLSVGVGWCVGAGFGLVVALAMAQVASAYPTAGGLYHWSSTLGSRGFGWVTAWFNLLGLVLVCASVNFGLYDPFLKTLVAPALGVDSSQWGLPHQFTFLVGATASQALLNHKAVALTTKLVDLSGWLIFVVTVALTVTLWACSTTPLDLSRLVTFTNFTGAPGSMWPASTNTVMVFFSGLLLTIYTITGFDASAHTAEETHDAATNVPKGIVSSVLWSSLFGFLMIATFVLVMPDLQAGVAQGSGYFAALLATVPAGPRVLLALALFVVNYLCALACLMSTSRMVFAFARDGGLPASKRLATVDATQKSPGAAIWLSAVTSIAATVYADAFVVLTTACAVFLYISYVLPVAAGLVAEGRTWTRKGPFDLGAWSRPVAALAVVGGVVLIVVGIQPPNEKVLVLIVALCAFLALFWWGLGERHRFRGPPRLG
jgi:amino acid transporter